MEIAASALGLQTSRCVEPYQRVPEPEMQRYGISYADCARRLRVITRAGKVRSGAFAVNHFFIHYFPWRLLVILLYVVPPLLLLEMLTYELVAKNRTRLSRLLGMKACLMQK